MAGVSNENLSRIRQQGIGISFEYPDGGICRSNAAKKIHMRSNAGRNTRIPAGAPMTTWTKLDIDVLKNCYSKNMETKEIARILKRSEASVFTRANLLGIRHPDRGTRRLFTDDHLNLLSDCGISPEEKVSQFLKLFPRSGIEINTIANFARRPSLARDELKQRESKKTGVQNKIVVPCSNKDKDTELDVLVKIHNQLSVIMKIQEERLTIVKGMIKK